MRQMFFDVYATVTHKNGTRETITERVEASGYTKAIAFVYFKLKADSGLNRRYTSYQVISAVRVDDEDGGPSGRLDVGRIA